MLDADTLPKLEAALRRYSLSLTKSSWDAADLAQSAWEKLFNRIQNDGHPNPEALLLRTAKNIWVDTQRRNSVYARIIRKETTGRTVTYGQIGEGLACEQLFQALLNRLTPMQFAAFMLSDALQYSAKESAMLLQASEGAVKAALHRARKALAGVREDLMENRLAPPQNEGEKELLHMLAAAYEEGDAAALVRLAKQDALEAAAAISAVQSRSMARKQTRASLTRKPEAMLAA